MFYSLIITCLGHQVPWQSVSVPKEYINGLWKKKPLGYSNASFSDRGVLSSSPVGSDEQRQTAHGQVDWKIPRICLMETQEKHSDEICVLWSQQRCLIKDLNAHEWTLKAMLVLCRSEFQWKTTNL